MPLITATTSCSRHGPDKPAEKVWQACRDSLSFHMLMSGQLAVEPVSRSAAKAIRSLGWELHCLRKGARLLDARVRNGTLPAALIEFLTPVLSAPDEEKAPPILFSLRVMARENEVRVPWDALKENGVSARLLALLHLPALRHFWERALRRSHFQRLRRVLPRAWFVTDDPPPIGAVAPGFGIAADGLRSGDVVIEEMKADDAPSLIAHYEHKDGRVNLRAAA